MSKVAITVSCSSDDATAVDRLAGTLEAMGTEVLAVHESIGIVSARAQERDLDSIRALEDVSAVEVGSRFQLPPPESDVQ